MLALLAAVAVAHLPNFKNKAFNKATPEPSQAYYMDVTADFQIDYAPGDLMLVQVLLPYASGVWKSGTPVKNVTISYSDGCAKGEEVEPGSHNKFSPAGSISDEAFAAGSYRTALTVASEMKATAYQRCNVHIKSTGAPYVFVVGTKEDIAEPYAVGFPIYIVMVSWWANNLFYPIGLVVALALAWLLQRRPDLKGYAQAFYLQAIEVATIINRAVQYEPMGWARASAGLLFILGPLAAIAVVWWAYRSTVATQRQIAACVFLVVIPTRSWIDVVVAIGFCAYNYYHARKYATVPQV